MRRWITGRSSAISLSGPKATFTPLSISVGVRRPDFITITAVSYTHLDVYKRQMMNISTKRSKFMFTKEYFADTMDRKPVFIFESQNTYGTKIQVLNYGGIIKSLQLQDRTGQQRDIVLGYDTLESYEKQDKYFGALIGRCANRIGSSCFSLDGKAYSLTPNDCLLYTSRCV